MKLSEEEVRHVAELAKLKLTDAEVTQFADQLSQMLDYAEILKDVDTSAIPPTPYVLPLENVMRDDESAPGLTLDDSLRNAPDRSDGFFRVRAVFEE